MFYVENWSVRLDLMIVFQTLVEVGRRAVARLRGDEVEPTPPAAQLAVPPTASRQRA